MRFMFGAGTRVLHITIGTGRWADDDSSDGGEPQRDTQLDAMVENAAHQSPRPPFGFAPNPDQLEEIQP